MTLPASGGDFRCSMISHFQPRQIEDLQQYHGVDRNQWLARGSRHISRGTLQLGTKVGSD